VHRLHSLRIPRIKRQHRAVPLTVPSRSLFPLLLQG
jgi:hypothetical protein